MSALKVLRDKVGRLSSSRVSLGVTSLISGAVLAQVISIAATPIVTRLYLPLDYASMALFASIVAVWSSISTGRYDTAIPLPQESPSGEREALRLVAVAWLLTFFTTFVGGLALVGAWALGIDLWKEQLGSWVIALPFAVMLISANQVLYQYSNRKREYVRLSTISPSAKLITSSTQISLGYLGMGRSGLLIPTTLAPLVGASLMARFLRDGARSAGLTKSDLLPTLLWRSACDHKDFPLVASWISLINALNTTVQIFVLATLFKATEVGHYALAMSLVSIPVSLIAGSVSSVYFREMASKHGDIAESLAFTRKTIKGLLIGATPVIIVIAACAEPLFPLVFGSQWSRSGHFAVALLPWIWVRLVGIPLSAAMAVSRRQAWQLIWQITLLIGFIASYVLGARFGANALTCTWIASAVSVPIYLLLIPMAWTAIRGQQPAVSPPATTQDK